jgi:MMP 1-O-methyltransferase
MSPPSRRTEIEGHIDLITPRQIFGWVWDKSDPFRQLDVFATVGEAEIAQGSARFLRPDLLSAGIGNGCYAFYLHFAQVPEDMLRSIRVGVRGTENFEFSFMPDATLDGPSLFVPQHLKDFKAVWSIAEQAKGWLTQEEAELLYNLARTAGSKGRVVELGSYCGRSSIVLAAGLIAESTKPLVCVDTFGGSPVHQPGYACFDPATLVEGVINTYPIFLRNLRQAGLQGLVEVMRMSTVDAAGNFLDPIELLFVDADHEYAAVAADLQAWTPKLAEGAFIVLHDFGHCSGVNRAAADLLDAGYRYYVQSGMALVLRKNKTLLPDAFTTNRDGGQAIRSA